MPNSICLNREGVQVRDLKYIINSLELRPDRVEREGNDKIVPIFTLIKPRIN